MTKSWKPEAILCNIRPYLLIDQRQRGSSFDLLSGLTRPGNRQQSPSLWTIRRRYTSIVGAYYGFNKCKPKAVPLDSLLFTLCLNICRPIPEANPGPSSSTISVAVSSQQGMSRDEIIHALAEETLADLAVVERDVNDFMEELKSRHLVTR
jgi:hypothetical protein